MGNDIPHANLKNPKNHPFDNIPDSKHKNRIPAPSGDPDETGAPKTKLDPAIANVRGVIPKNIAPDTEGNGAIPKDTKTTPDINPEDADGVVTHAEVDNANPTNSDANHAALHNADVHATRGEVNERHLHSNSNTTNLIPHPEVYNDEAKKHNRVAKPINPSDSLTENIITAGLPLPNETEHGTDGVISEGTPAHLAGTEGRYNPAPKGN